MCSFGTDVDMSALPSFVHTTMSPVSATPKFAPVIPQSAVMKLSLRWYRAHRVRYVGSAGGAASRSAFEICGSASRMTPFFSKHSSTSSFVMCIAGMTIWLGARCMSWRMRSPRSVSTTSMPSFSRCSLRWHSSVSIDLLFTTFLTPWLCMISMTMLLYSFASFAQCTWAPFSVAAFSNISR